ncbi:hypothetical protein [Ramlibacter sp.]|uniref:hypothetical protein n=1 Tax=Ramlibacter sp. TaxID=1917967 RepID=UPI002FC66628
MKITPIVLAAVLAASGGAWAQARDGSQTPGEHAAADAAADGRTFGEKVRSAADKVGDAARRTFDRARGESREAARDASRADDRQARKADKRSGERHAKAARDRGDARAMGAPGRSMDADPDADPGRRGRMDEAYANWKSRQNR